jgi:hypothetical protein
VQQQIRNSRHASPSCATPAAGQIRRSKKQAIRLTIDMLIVH